MSKKKISLGGFFKAPKKKTGYGLISPAAAFGKSKPKAKPAGMKATLDVFKQAAEEDLADRGKSGVNRELVSQQAKKRTQQMMEAASAEALAQDATIFDYDGAYDEIQKQREEAIEGHALNRARKREKKESKYIGQMLEQSKIKEMKEDRIRERRLLKEREEEDHLFGDRDKYVTAAYKRKLEESKKWEEEDLRLERLETRDDVRKKGGTHHFLSNLLTKNTAFGADVAKNATSAYTAGSGRVDSATGSVATEREVKRAKLDEENAKKVVERQQQDKQREQMEQAKQEIQEKRQMEAAEAAKQAKEDEKADLLAQAAKKKAAKKAKLEAIKAAKARFAQRKAENLKKPPPSEDNED